MARFKQAKVSIKGTKPLLWNRFRRESIPLTRVERSGVSGHDPTEWQRSVLITQERQLYILPTYVFGCIRDGAKFTGNAKSGLQKRISSTLQISDHIILIKDRFLPEKDLSEDPSRPVYLDVTSVRNPNSRGSRNIRYRAACSPGWELTFTAIWDSTIVEPQVLQAILNDAGDLVGLGDGRSIGYGRFSLQTYEVSDLNRQNA